MIVVATIAIVILIVIALNANVIVVIPNALLPFLLTVAMSLLYRLRVSFSMGRVWGVMQHQQTGRKQMMGH